MKKTKTNSDERPLPPQPPPMHEILAEQAKKYGDRTLVEFDDRILSYRDLDRDSRHVAAAMQRRGVKKDDPVMMMLGNRSEFLITFFATAHIGAISVPVNVALKGESLTHIFQVTKAPVIVIEAGYIERLYEAIGIENCPQQMFVVADNSVNLDNNACLFSEIAAEENVLEPVVVTRSDPMTILFTSGTTGVAKGVILPHQQVSSAAWDAVNDTDMDESSVFYTFNPLFHLNGLIFGPLATIIAGGKTVVRYSFPREHTMPDIKKTRATHWTAVPFLIRELLAAPERSDDKDNDLRSVLTFGLSEDEIIAFRNRYGCTTVEGYGCSETGMICSVQSERPATAGRVSHRFDMRIVDTEGNDTPEGEVGEIWVRTRQPFDRMLGYYNMPEATAAVISGDWVKTGDLGYLDADGFLHFSDRLKDSLKRRGENISTYEVERVLMNFPGVDIAVVTGFRPTPEGDEEVRAFIKLAEQARDVFEYEALIKHCSANLAYFMIPRFIDLVQDFPRTSVGKIRKQEMKEIPLSKSTFDLKTSGITIER